MAHHSELECVVSFNCKVEKTGEKVRVVLLGYEERANRWFTEDVTSFVPADELQRVEEKLKLQIRRDARKEARELGL